MESLLFALVTCLPVVAADAKQPDPPPAKIELFAKEDWYKEEKGKEREFVGVLQKIERKGFGFGRMNPYYFTMADTEKPNVRQVYMGGKADLLAPYVGKKIKLVGKPVEFLKLEGRDYFEIWPARAELLPQDKVKDKAKEDKKGADAGKDLKIHARATWPYTKTDPDDRQKPIQLVLRSAAELVTETPFRDRDALPQVVEKQATAEFAKHFKVDTIDWNKQMIVVASTGTLSSGGIIIDVTRIVAEKDKVAVYWKTNNPQIVTNAFTHPSQMVLVDRADGKAEFRNASRDGPKVRR